MNYTQNSGPPIDAAAERELLRRHKNGDKEATETLINNCMGMVIKTAKKYQKPGVEFDDLMQEGALGLMEAMDRFDIQSGNRFLTYASSYVLKNVFQHANDGIIKPSRRHIEETIKIDRFKQKFTVENGREPSEREIAEALNLSITTIKNAVQTQVISLSLNVSDDHEMTVEDTIEDESLRTDPVREAIITALDMLDEKDQKLLRQLYGIDERKRSAEEIAAEENVTRAAIYLRRDAALRKLRSPKKLQKIREELKR